MMETGMPLITPFPHLILAKVQHADLQEFLSKILAHSVGVTMVAPVVVRLLFVVL
jgi:hypothetical protein